MNPLSRRIAEEALRIGAIKLQPEEPFTWTSGYRMPIYCDNRMFLFHPELRQLILQGFEQFRKDKRIDIEVIAGTATAGIPHATTFADHLHLPLVYVRSKPKGHGLQNRIEGIDANEGLGGRYTLVIEDLISTGGSSASAVQAVRDANGVVEECWSIFNYGFDDAEKRFGRLQPPCKVRSLLYFRDLVQVATDIHHIDFHQSDMLRSWSDLPYEWGAENGFRRVRTN